MGEKIILSLEGHKRPISLFRLIVFAVKFIMQSCSISQALADLNGKDLEGEHIEIVFAKPPDQKRKERKAQRQAAKTQM